MHNGQGSQITDGPLPKISCLMVTADRRRLCERSVRCYKRQTYPNRELVVVDDGSQDLTPVFADLSEEEVIYVKLPQTPKKTLGELRNVALESATGEFCAQWDDDDWYHRDRLKLQAESLLQGYDACCLYGTLMHVNTDEFRLHPYIGYLKDGVPGTIMHRRDPNIQYPKQPRAEDTTFLNKWREKRYTLLPASEAYLFIRYFHGDNTWDKKHFLTRIRNTVPDALKYIWYRYVKNDLFKHPRFRLSDQARASFEQYMEDSADLNLQTPVD